MFCFCLYHLTIPLFPIFSLKTTRYIVLGTCNINIQIFTCTFLFMNLDTTNNKYQISTTSLGVHLLRQHFLGYLLNKTFKKGIFIDIQTFDVRQCTVDSYWGSPIHLPVTPAWPVTSEKLDYCMCCRLV